MSIEQCAIEILRRAGKPLHYKTIARQILDQNFSGLKSQGGKTPEQSVGSILSRNKVVFRSFGGGYYGLPHHER